MDKAKFQMMFVATSLFYPDIDITPRIALAQAVLESANFTSDVYEANHNFLGMKIPAKRETTCTNKGQAGIYAKYSSDLDCMRDLFLWCREWGLTDDTKLAAFVKTKYSETADYGQRVANVIASLDAQRAYIAPAAILAGGAVLTAALAAAGYKGVQLLNDMK